MAGTIRAQDDRAAIGLGGGIDQLDEVVAELARLAERLERQQERIWAELARQALAAPPRPVINLMLCPGPIGPPQRPRGWTVAS